MSKDFESCDYENLDVKNDISSDMSSDIGNDIVGNEGVDLNAKAQDKLEKNGLEKRTIAEIVAFGTALTAPFAPLAAETTEPRHYDVPNDIPAYYTEAPSHVGRTPEQVAAEMGAIIEEGDPAPDNRGMKS